MEESNQIPPVEELIRRGSLGVLATGYRGVLAWKANRPPLPESRPEPEERDEQIKGNGE